MPVWNKKIKKGSSEKPLHAIGGGIFVNRITYSSEKSNNKLNTYRFKLQEVVRKSAIPCWKVKPQFTLWNRSQIVWILQSKPLNTFRIRGLARTVTMNNIFIDAASEVKGEFVNVTMNNIFVEEWKTVYEWSLLNTYCKWENAKDFIKILVFEYKEGSGWLYACLL